MPAVTFLIEFVLGWQACAVACLGGWYTVPVTNTTKREAPRTRSKLNNWRLLETAVNNSNTTAVWYAKTHSSVNSHSASSVKRDAPARHAEKTVKQCSAVVPHAAVQ